jgi:hypothetical protein
MQPAFPLGSAPSPGTDQYVLSSLAGRVPKRGPFLFPARYATEEPIVFRDVE